MTTPRDATSRFVQIVDNTKGVSAGERRIQSCDEETLGRRILRDESLAMVTMRLRIYSGHAQDEAASLASAGTVSS